MDKTKLLNEIKLKFQEGCKITTRETFNDKVMYGDYFFNLLEEYINFFETEYNDMLVRKVHNTQILSWEFVYEYDR